MEPKTPTLSPSIFNPLQADVGWEPLVASWVASRVALPELQPLLQALFAKCARVHVCCVSSYSAWMGVLTWLLLVVLFIVGVGGGCGNGWSSLQTPLSSPFHKHAHRHTAACAHKFTKTDKHRYIDVTVEHCRRTYQAAVPVPVTSQVQAVCRILEGLLPKVRV